MEDDEESDSNRARRHLNACLHGLEKAETDTEKFASLLMVTKSIKAEECSTDDKKHLLEAVGLSFFIRLLRTKDDPGGCGHVFKSVAVTILSALVVDCDMAADKCLGKVLPHVKSILETSFSKEVTEDRALLQETARDTFTLLSRMAGTVAGGHMLLDSGYPQFLVQILDNNPDEEIFVMTQTLLIQLQSQQGDKVWAGREDVFDRYLSVLSQRLSACQDKHVIDMCELTTCILGLAPKGESKTRTTAVQPLVDKLSSLIRSRLGVSQRQSVLGLVNQVTVTLGVDCLLPPAVPDYTLWLLVLHLTTIEVRLALENSTPHQLNKYAAKLCLHFNALETMLDFLCRHDDDQSLPLPAEAFCQAHDALLGAATGLFYFLQQLDIDNLCVDMITVASVRMMAAITCQAFEEVKENVAALLPVLLKLCEAEIGMLKTSTRKGNNGDHSETLIPASTNQTTQHRTSTHSTLPPSDLHPAHSDISLQIERLAINRETSEANSYSEKNKETDVKPCSKESGQINVETCREETAETNAEACRDESEKSNSETNFKDLDHLDSVQHQNKPETNSAPVIERENIHKSVDGSTQDVSHSDRSCHRDGKTRQPSSRADDCELAKEGSSAERRLSEERVSGSEGTDSDQQTQVLPRTLDDLRKWVCCRPQGAGDGGVSGALPGLEVMKFLIPVWQCVCEDRDLQSVFMSLSGHTVLTAFLQHTHPSLLSDHPMMPSVQEMLACQILQLLMVLARQCGEQGQRDLFTNLFHFVLTTLPQLDLGDKLFMYTTHLVAMGLLLLPVSTSQRLSDHQDLVDMFLDSAVRFISKAVADIAQTNTAATRWQQVQDVWAGSDIGEENTAAVMGCLQQLSLTDDRVKHLLHR